MFVFIALIGLCLCNLTYGVYNIGVYGEYRKKKAYFYKDMHTDLNGAPLSFTNTPVATSDLSPGDHIYVAIGGAKAGVTSPSRFISSLGYHHGVFLGRINGEHRVADFGREQNTHPVTTSLNVFMYENPTTQLYLRRYTSGYIRSVEDILEQADKMEGRMEWGCYDLVNNNCEHFATFLKTGKKWSAQANAAF